MARCCSYYARTRMRSVGAGIIIEIVTGLEMPGTAILATI
jgi:hypothetical protein